MSISSAANYAAAFIPTNMIYKVGATALPVISKNISRIAMAAIAMAGVSSIPLASGGPVTYGMCVGTCASLVGPAIAICIEGCLPLLASPTP